MTLEKAIKCLTVEIGLLSSGYYDYLAHGGKQDVAEEEFLDSLDMAISALREQPKWISVEERLPEKGVFVLFHYAKNGNPTSFAKNTMAVGRYEYGMFLVEGCSVCVTHWMPLPELPTEEDA